MPSSASARTSNSVSPVSSLATNRTSTITTTSNVQSGPYTKAQFLSTMEGSRSVKNTKEIEDLLRDYPNALELYRTGRYKVKVKHENSFQRVILVEKRSSKATSDTSAKTSDNQQSSTAHVNQAKTEKESDKNENIYDRTRSHTNSVERAPVTSSSTNNDKLVQTTTSSMHVTTNAQPKVDQHPISSKERELSVTSEQKKKDEKVHHDVNRHRRSHSHHSSSNTSYSKQKDKKHRQHPKTLVPYNPNIISSRNPWERSRALQPFYNNNSILSQQAYQPNNYMAQTYIQPQPYYFGAPTFPTLTYQKPPINSIPPSVTKSIKTSTYTNPLSTQTVYDPNAVTRQPGTFQTFYSNQQQYLQSQLPFQASAPWHAINGATGFATNNNTQMDTRQGSKHRAHSVDTGPRNHPPIGYYNQQQPSTIVHERFHHHRYHHQHQQPINQHSQATNSDVNNNGVSIGIPKKEENIQSKETVTTANNSSAAEKLTIRQLNDIFSKTDSTGRLPYSSLPNVLQRFGLLLNENDLITAARDLQYNLTEPVSARRLVHMLIKLGKVARAPNQEKQQAPLSPAILPEDREVNDIMTKRRTIGATSTHIHSSIHPNHWY